MLKQIIFLVVSMYLKKKNKENFVSRGKYFLAGAFSLTRSTAIKSIKIILKCLHDNNTYSFFPSCLFFTGFIFFKLAIS